MEWGRLNPRQHPCSKWRWLRMMIEQVGNPKGLKPLTPGNLEWCNPEVPEELEKIKVKKPRS
jgi:hypothetical protein